MLHFIVALKQHNQREAEGKRQNKNGYSILTVCLCCCSADVSYHAGQVKIDSAFVKHMRAHRLIHAAHIYAVNPVLNLIPDLFPK